MRASLIVNPAAGRGTAARVAGTVAATLRDAVGSLRVDATADAAGIRELAAIAAGRGDDVLAVLGGDGTAHLAVQALAGSDTALAVIPSGSGNDFAAALGIPPDPAAGARHVAVALTQHRRRRIDLGRTDRGAAVATVLCTGFDARVNARANSMRWSTGARRYELAVMAELTRLTPQQVSITTPAGEVALQATLVAVGNGPCYGGGLRICPGARLDDGLLDVTVVGRVSRRRLLRVFPALRAGRHVDEPEVTTVRATAVTLRGPAWPVYADGEPQGTLPVTMHCEPGALAVIA